MAWPPTPNVATGFLATGVTSIRWGTDGVMATSGVNGSGGGFNGYYILETDEVNDEVDTSYIENGTGVKCTRIGIWQGRKKSFTVVDDTNMTPPAPQSQVALYDEISGDLISTWRVIDNNYQAVRKVEGKRRIVCEYLFGIEGVVAGAPTIPSGWLNTTQP